MGSFILDIAWPVVVLIGLIMWNTFAYKKNRFVYSLWHHKQNFANLKDAVKLEQDNTRKLILALKEAEVKNADKIATLEVKGVFK